MLRSAAAERALFNFGATSVIRGDCREPAAWEHTLEGIPILLHLAPVSLAPGIVDVARRKGVHRFIAISSTRGLTHLNDELAEGVREGETAIRDAPLVYTILRCSMIYGSKRDANVDRIARWLEQHQWLPLIDGGTAQIQPVHLDDVVDAVLKTLALPGPTRNATLTVAGPASLSWREMAETLAELKGKRIRWVPVPRKPARLLARGAARLSSRFAGFPDVIERLGEDRQYDISETCARLAGWRPMDFRTGAERTYGGDVNRPVMSA